MANGETAEAVEPRQCALDHPAIASRALAGIHAAAGNPGHDGAPPAFRAAAALVISFVGVQFVRAASRATRSMPHRRHGIECGCEHEAVMPVGPAQAQTERCARPVDHNMALRARFAEIRRVRAGGSAPFFAAMDEASSAARFQLSLSASARRSSRMRCRRVHTPAACQSRNRRQHVIPERPISKGNIFQGMPERRTKRIPAKAARSSTRGRPPLGLTGSRERSGSITAHRAWETRGLAMPNQRPHLGFVRRSKYLRFTVNECRRAKTRDDPGRGSNYSLWVQVQQRLLTRSSAVSPNYVVAAPKLRSR
ncbi:hypothetical protein MicloDRAFT_00030280 [Microvirga lotononidis]|uniref:Uncharacterized protein n=1 Tax=Microvirga lotononidis TaxID=864069 RepID=I4YR87_9HYPH|nr:hypothetical protein MicloDRAFT_00030280 [Microvirga lotononidis]